jgi:transcriptional regulator with XRE-family HTH domain
MRHSEGDLTVLHCETRIPRGEVNMTDRRALDMENEKAPSNHDAHVGGRIRAMRRVKGISARELADKAGISPGYLSRLENDKVSPTVAMVTRVVQAMGGNVAQLFDDEASGPVIRRDMRKVVRHRGVEDFFVTPVELKDFLVLETIVAAGSGSGEPAYAHGGEWECVFVIEGFIDIWLGDEKFRLRSGDSVTFHCDAPHRWRNPGGASARLMWIVTPSGY